MFLLKKMMRKKLLFAFSMTLVVVCAPAQDRGQTVVEKDLEHWSIGTGAGVDYYRVDPFDNSKTVLSRYLEEADYVNLGQIFTEYTVNPLYGFGVDLGIFTYNRSEGNGRTVDLTVFESTNLSNLLAPERKGFWTKTNFYGDLGGGVGFYSGKLVGQSAYSSATPMFLLNFNAEHNLSRLIALGVSGQYRTYLRHNLGGEWSTDFKNNDGFVATINLRFKLGDQSKKHVRDISVAAYYGNPEPVEVAHKADYQADSQWLERLKASEDENAAIKGKLNALEQQLNDLKEKVDAAPERKIEVDSIWFENVEFVFNTTTLVNSSVPVLDNVVSALKKATWNQLKVTGYTDSIGSNTYNKRLSLERAMVIKAYLVSKGFSESSIVVDGRGEEKPIVSNETREGREKNRRTEFEILK
jgi:outer membrane protein OmpA-like peptidoglycan-associated protein